MHISDSGVWRQREEVTGERSQNARLYAEWEPLWATEEIIEGVESEE